MMLRERAVHDSEKMDSPDCDPERLRRTYRQFPLVNRAFAGWSTAYRRYIRPLLSIDRDTTLLDLGCGGGDVALYLNSLAKKDGLLLTVTGVDPDPRAMDFALSRRDLKGVAFRQAAGGDLLAEGKAFDLVISNHVLHHLGFTEFRNFLRESEQLSRRFVLHNDLRRHPAAYALFGLAALPLRNSYIREDGLTSIRRSYSPDELAAAAPPPWRVVPTPPFRQLLLLERDSPAGARD